MCGTFFKLVILKESRCVYTWSKFFFHNHTSLHIYSMCTVPCELPRNSLMSLLELKTFVAIEWHTMRPAVVFSKWLEKKSSITFNMTTFRCHNSGNCGNARDFCSIESHTKYLYCFLKYEILRKYILQYFMNSFKIIKLYARTWNTSQETGLPSRVGL